jgi:hypothetical protein
MSSPTRITIYPAPTERNNAYRMADELTLRYPGTIITIEGCSFVFRSHQLRELPKSRQKEARR